MAALSLLGASWACGAVDINTASVSKLQSLPGIGASKAEAIVEYRNQNGNFKSVEDLKNVKGIGEGILNLLRDDVTVVDTVADHSTHSAETALAA